MLSPSPFASTRSGLERRHPAYGHFIDGARTLHEARKIAARLNKQLEHLSVEEKRLKRKRARLLAVEAYYEGIDT